MHLEGAERDAYIETSRLQVAVVKQRLKGAKDVPEAASALCKSTYMLFLSHSTFSVYADVWKQRLVTVFLWCPHLSSKACRAVDLVSLAITPEETAERLMYAEASFGKALKACQRLLGPTHPFTVQVALQRALMLVDIADRPNDAMAAAEEMLRLGEAKIDRGCPAQVLMLNMVRNCVVHLDDMRAQAPGLGPTGQEPAVQQACVQAGQSVPRSMRSSPGRRTKRSDRTSIERRVRKDDLSIDDAVMKYSRTPNVHNRQFSGMRALLEALSQSPVVLDDMIHGAEIMSALRQIFTTYVNSQSVPAELKSGDLVELNGKQLPLQDYLIDGPYMRWNGLLSLCYDFGVCPGSDNATKSGAGRNGEFLLDKHELAAIFASTIMSCARPLLWTRDGLSKAAHKRRTKGSNEPLVRDDQEAWERVVSVAAAGEVSWSDGLDWDQFIDCLARCAIVAFTANRTFEYDEMYPRVHDKLQGLFTSHMGVLDSHRVGALCQARLLSTVRDGPEDIQAAASPPDDGVRHSPTRRGSPLPKNGRR